MKHFFLLIPSPFSRILLFISFLGIVFANIKCQWRSTSPVDPSQLLHTEAIERKSLVSNIQYHLDIKLPPEGDFQGTTTIEFDWNQKASQLRLDFSEGKVESLVVNGKSAKIDYNNYSIQISRDDLSQGKNKVVVGYSHPYSTTGNGLHRFQDPADGRIYLYTQFEAFHANKMFPCFDQPDLKASYSLEVEAPSDWVVISSVYPTVETLDSTKKKWNFSKSPVFSTYLLSLQAGPYTEWKRVAKTPQGEIPMRIFARQSLASFVDTKFWFDSTETGLNFFESYFKIPYPFGKYDQIIVPEFNFGAMENVGAVNFSERFVSRGKLTRTEKLNLNEIILHEMAHMWFGNLVTMKWWNGLWLNESFASYMSFLAEQESTESQEPWKGFFIRMKSWGYSEDRLSTTHPIETKIQDTEEAFTNFDGITYGKGASVLKQLSFLLGKEVFREGVSRYLKKYSYSNAELKDFLSSLEEVQKEMSPKKESLHSLKEWSKDWLETKGLNRVTAQWSCKDTKIASFSMEQTNVEGGNKLRLHKTQIGLFQKIPKWNLFHSQNILYNGKTTVVGELIGKPCPDFVYTNLNDHDYAFHILDDVSRNNIPSFLTNTTDGLLKQMLWHELWMDVVSGKRSLNSFTQLAMETVPKETDELLVSSILSKLTSSSPISYLSSIYWNPNLEGRTNAISKLESFLWDGVQNNQKSKDLQKIWFRNFQSVATTEASLQKLVQILESLKDQKDLELNQDDRWKILLRLYSFSFAPEKLNPILEAEKTKDKSERARNYLLALSAIQPNSPSKEEAWKLITNPDPKVSNTSRYVVMRSLFPIHQSDFHRQFTDRYYQVISGMDAKTDVNYAENFSSILLPSFCSQESLNQLSQFLSSHPKLPSSAVHEMQGGLDLEKDCLCVRNRNSQNP